MTLDPPSPGACALGATHRRLTLGILAATLLLSAGVIADLAVGGRADPPALRAAATLLDGAWRFRTGDDPHWADPDLDDSSWETIDLTAPPGSHDGDVGLPDYVGGWMARGHADYHGYAWYRRAVTVPASPGSWEILGPTLVEDGYELYWNDHLLGGSGRLGAHPRLVGTRPLRFPLPAEAVGTRGVLAVRVYMRPESGSSADGGGMHTPPILAPRPAGEALHRAQWRRTIAGYIVEVIEPLAMLTVVALALVYRSRGGRQGFLILASIALVLTAARRLNNAIVSWTDLQDLATYGWLASVMWVPTLAAWLMAWNRWDDAPWRGIDASAIVLAVAGIAGALMPSAALTRGGRLGSLALFVVIGARIARRGPMRTLALVTLASIVAGFFGGELIDPLGVPGIWFPFGIGVSRIQYLYAIMVPLLAVLIVWSLPSARERHD
jgi:hypothetical protein